MLLVLLLCTAIILLIIDKSSMNLPKIECKKDKFITNIPAFYKITGLLTDCCCLYLLSENVVVFILFCIYL